MRVERLPCIIYGVVDGQGFPQGLCGVLCFPPRVWTAFRGVLLLGVVGVVFSCSPCKRYPSQTVFTSRAKKLVMVGTSTQTLTQYPSSAEKVVAPDGKATAPLL